MAYSNQWVLNSKIWGGGGDMCSHMIAYTFLILSKCRDSYTFKFQKLFTHKVKFIHTLEFKYSNFLVV